MTDVEIRGVVTPFNRLGRSLGYPTANVNANQDLKDGVYFGYATLGRFKDNPAMIFIGTPTVPANCVRRVEAHLLGIPDQDYYDQEISISPRHFYRNNLKVNSPKELEQLLDADLRAALNWFNSGSKE